MIDIQNWAAFSAFAVSVLCLLIYIYLIPRQAQEIAEPRDWFTPVRWTIFVMFIIGLVTSLPTVWYLWIRALGGEDEFIRNISSISGRLSALNYALPWLLFFLYPRKKR